MPETSSGKLNRLTELLAAGKPTFGLIATIPSIQSVQILANAGVDWLDEPPGLISCKVVGE